MQECHFRKAARGFSQKTHKVSTHDHPIKFLRFIECMFYHQDPALGSYRMKTKKVLTATLLSAGLMMGSVSSASAEESTPTPTPTSSASASATATATATTYQAQLEAYKLALVAYRTNLAKYGAAIKESLKQYEEAWKLTLEQYEAARKAAIANYKADTDKYLAAWKIANERYLLDSAALKVGRQAVNTTFQAAVAKAIADFKTSMVTATTADQKSVAETARKAAIAAATAGRKSALDALGPEPVRPSKPNVPTKLVLPVRPTKPAAPIKPVAPIKPIAPTKPVASVKPLAPTKPARTDSPPKKTPAANATEKTENSKRNDKKR